MIKIIKDGVIPKLTNRIYKATCKHCGCEFEFETEDIKIQEKKINGCITVECPYCHNDITRALFKYREVEENENNICNTCKLNNCCPLNHKPNLQCPYDDYEKR